MQRWITLSAIVTVSALTLAQTRPSDVKLSGTDSLQIERLATLEFPWGMAYLPDGRLLVTEKPGRLRIYDGKRLSEPVASVPAVSYRATPSEQGGLLDVAVDPDFAQNQRIYLLVLEEAPTPPGAAETAIRGLRPTSTSRTTA